MKLIGTIALERLRQEDCEFKTSLGISWKPAFNIISKRRILCPGFSPQYWKAKSGIVAHALDLRAAGAGSGAGHRCGAIQVNIDNQILRKGL